MYSYTIHDKNFCDGNKRAKILPETLLNMTQFETDYLSSQILFQKITLFSLDKIFKNSFFHSFSKYPAEIALGFEKNFDKQKNT